MTRRNAIDLRLPLVFGFTVLAVATLVAFRNPATEYEVSIYAGTPTIFWIAVAISLLISVIVVFVADGLRLQRVGFGLGGVAMISVVAAPLIRGYYWIGEADALTHLGWALDIQEGVLPISELRYPAVHTLSLLTSSITGLEVTHTLLLFVVVFVGTFFAFVPLVVRALTSDYLVVAIGFFSALLLLQVNFFGVHMQIHPTSQAVMFAPVILFFFVKSYMYRDPRYFASFAVVMAMFVMLHPQQGANFLIFFGAIAGFQLFINAVGQTQRSPKQRVVFSSAVLIASLFWLWTRGMRLTGDSSLEGFVVSLFVVETDPGSAVEGRSVSLRMLGGSMEEMFVKLFLVASIFCIFTGLLMVTNIAKLLDFRYGRRLQEIFTSDEATERELLVFITIGFIAVVGMFFGYLIGDMSSQYFRHYGFMMVIVTVMGSIFLARFLKHLKTSIGPDQWAAIAIVLVFCFLLMSIPVVHSSPYVYRGSGHVPESQIDGFERSFEYWSDEKNYGNVRSLTTRYDDAINGDRSESHYIGDEQDVPTSFANQSLHEHWEEPAYLTVTRSDYVRTTGLYQEFRYSQDDFQYLESQKGINKIQAGGGFDLYSVQPQEV